MALLPVAQAGLDRADVERDDSAPLLELIASRVASGQTGAAWQRSALERLEATRPREEALSALLELYLAHSREGAPVHTWPEASG